MSAHSPLPWWVSGKGVIRSGKDIWVASCYWRNKYANAALIVRAVNAHDELVAALRSIEGLHVPDQPLSSACDEHVWVRRHVAKLRGIAAAALAKLEQPA